jgi:FkbM family methyltransferase
VKTVRSSLIQAVRRILPDGAAPVIDSVYYAVKLARNPRSFYRYLRLLLDPRAPVEVSLRGLAHPIFLRPATTDALVAFGTLGEGCHLPPGALPEDAIIVDLGANIGLTAADYASRYSKATVIAVEMDDSNAAIAVRNTAYYRDRVTVIQAAAWWEATRLSYAAQKGDEWGFALSEQGDREVATVAVADLVEQYGPVDFLKMDIEGAEQQVLSNSTSWASAVRYLQVEVHQPYTVEQCERDLRDLGFATERHPTHPASVNATRIPTAR